MGKCIDLTGKSFGRLTVICRAPNKIQPNGAKVTMWRCICDCGKEKDISADNLKTGHTKSCGCFNSEKLKRPKTHGGTLGHKRERLYRIWCGMIERCYRKNSISYRNYGGKGVTVCKEWRCDYRSFRSWAISNGYSDDLTIDRIDSKKGYSPSNCRWVNRIVQNNNTSRNTFITAFGKTKTIAEWSRDAGIKPATISARIRKLGWTPEKAVSHKI